MVAMEMGGRFSARSLPTGQANAHRIIVAISFRYKGQAEVMVFLLRTSLLGVENCQSRRGPAGWDRLDRLYCFPKLFFRDTGSWLNVAQVDRHVLLHVLFALRSDYCES